MEWRWRWRERSRGDVSWGETLGLWLCGLFDLILGFGMLLYAFGIYVLLVSFKFNWDVYIYII